MIAFGSYSQTSDTIIVNKVKFVKLLEEGMNAKVYKEQRDSLLVQTGIQNKLLEIRQASITNLNAQITDYKSIIAKHESIEQNINDKVKIAQDAIAEINNQLRKQKRKTRWTAFAGILAVGATIFLLK